MAFFLLWGTGKYDIIECKYLVAAHNKRTQRQIKITCGRRAFNNVKRMPIYIIIDFNNMKITRLTLMATIELFYFNGTGVPPNDLKFLYYVNIIWFAL